SATYFFEPKNFTFPFGTHVCVVEIDKDTGETKIVRHVAVDDCGKVINPLLVDGQVHGGIVQSIGQALYEEVVYDVHLLTGRLPFEGTTDYELMRAVVETPAPRPSALVAGMPEAVE